LSWDEPELPQAASEPAASRAASPAVIREVVITG